MHFKDQLMKDQSRCNFVSLMDLHLLHEILTTDTY